MHCNSCLYKSCTPFGLIMHKKKVHGQLRNNLQCKSCDYKTNSRRKLDKHSTVKTKPVHCNSCLYKSCTTFGLTMHKKEVHGQQKVVTNKVKKHLQCKSCDYRTNERGHLEKHSTVKTEPVHCNSCLFKSCTPFGLIIHKKKVHGQLRNKLQCKSCDYKTYNRSNLEIHSKLKTKPVHCNFCLYKSCSSFGLAIHEKVHGKQVLKCKNCDYKTGKKHLFEKHCKIGGEPVQCSHCPYKSCSPFGLTMHKKKVHGEQKVLYNTEKHFQCKYCDFKTGYKNNLKNHGKMGTKPVQCNHCPYKHCSPGGLRIHKKKVHGEVHIAIAKCFQCKNCDYKCKARNKLRKHCEVAQTQPVQCNFCLYKSCTIAGLNMHKAQFHSSQKNKYLHCKNCDYKTQSADSLKNHCKVAQTQPVQCKFCSYKSCTIAGLDRHFRDEHKTMYEKKVHDEYLPCKNCDYKAKMRRTLRRHHLVAQRQPLQCNFCSYKSCTSGGLTMHKRFEHISEKIKLDTQSSNLDIFNINLQSVPKNSCQETDDTLELDGKQQQCLICEQSPINCDQCFVKAIISDMIDGIELKKTYNANEIPSNQAKKSYQCKRCDFNGGSKHVVDKHMLRKVNTAECTYCPFKSCTAIGLAWHMRQIHSTKLFRCKRCDYKTDDNSSLKRHMENQTDPMQCNHCSFKTCSVNGLIVHKRKFHDPEHFQCKTCHYKFTELVKYKKHITIQKKIPLQCSQCAFKYCSSVGIWMHVHKVHGGRYQCGKCDYFATTKSKLNSHMTTQSFKTNPVHCNLCSFKSCSEMGLITHEREVHDKETKTSPTDNQELSEYEKNRREKRNEIFGKSLNEKVLALKPESKSLEKEINPTKKYQCKKCDYNCSDKKKLKRHTMASQGNPIQCNQCSYKYCSVMLLNTHWRKSHQDVQTQKGYIQRQTVHKQKGFKKAHGKGKFQCKSCDFHSMFRNDLIRHMKIQTDNPGHCIHCPFKSCSTQGLSLHMRIFHGKKLHVKLKPNMEKHMEIQSNPVQCIHCPFKTCSAMGLTLHKQKFHGKKCFQCERCDYYTKSKPNMDKHMKIQTSPVQCIHCPFKSCSAMGLTLHKRKFHGKKRFQCERCDYNTKSKQNVEKHMKKRMEIQTNPVQCKYCPFKSCSTQGLALHMRKFHGKKCFQCERCDYNTEYMSKLETHTKT